MQVEILHYAESKIYKNRIGVFKVNGCLVLLKNKDIKVFCNFIGEEEIKQCLAIPTTKLINAIEEKIKGE